MAKQFFSLSGEGAGPFLSRVLRATEGVTSAFWKQQSDRDPGRNSTREKIRASTRETFEQRTGRGRYGSIKAHLASRCARCAGVRIM